MKKNSLVRAFVSMVAAIAMAAVFGGCMMPGNFPGGWGGMGMNGWGGGFNGGWRNQIVVRPPNAMVGAPQPLGAPNPVATPAAQQQGSNYVAAAVAGRQQGGAYIVGANPTNPYGVDNSVPLPGTFRVQTGCSGGQWFVPSTGTCSSTAWIPGVETVWVPNGGVANVQANQMGPAGGVQGVPGATMPYGQPNVGGFQGYQQQMPWGGGNNFMPFY